MPQFIAPAMGVAGGVMGLIGQHKQNKQMDKSIQGLQQYGQGGLQDFNMASTGYQQAFQNPEQFTGGTAAQLGQQTQSQLGGISRTLGRSGAAGASARDLLTENTKNNMQARLQAKMGALGGLSQLGGMGIHAQDSALGGMFQKGKLNLAQDDIFQGLGGSLHDIFSGMPNPFSKGKFTEQGTGSLFPNDPTVTTPPFISYGNRS